MKDVKWWRIKELTKTARDIVYFNIKHLFASDEKEIDIKHLKSGWMTHEVFRQEDWFRIKTGGIIKTGSRTSEDFRQEDWFRVGGDHDIRNHKTGGSTTIRLAHTCPF